MNPPSLNHWESLTLIHASTGHWFTAHPIPLTDVSVSLDPCRGQPQGWTHNTGTAGCGEYWTCGGGRSVPQCCQQGHRYSQDGGCVSDASCRDACSLEWTLQASGQLQHCKLQFSCLFLTVAEMNHVCLFVCVSACTAECFLVICMRICTLFWLYIIGF